MLSEASMFQMETCDKIGWCKTGSEFNLLEGGPKKKTEIYFGLLKIKIIKLYVKEFHC